MLLAAQASGKEGAYGRTADGEHAPSLAAPNLPRPRAVISLISSKRPEAWSLGSRAEFNPQGRKLTRAMESLKTLDMQS